MTRPGRPNQWWRWPLMPFAAVIGAILGAAIITAINWFFMKFQGGYAEDGWWYLYIKPMFHAGIFGFLYAWIAGYVAPRGKVIASIVMTTILGVLGVVLLAFGWAAPATTWGQGIAATIQLVAAVAAAIFGVLVTKEQEESEQRSERYAAEIAEKLLTRPRMVDDENAPAA